MLAPGSTFGGYEIESVVGVGGIGILYRARQLRLDRPVALKLVEPDKAKRDQLIEQAYKIAQEQDWGYIPLHQQALAWGVSKKVKLTQRADNQVSLYWATKQE